MSVYLLALSLVPFIIDKLGKKYGAEINAISACLSLLMLVVSVIESMRDHGRVAHLYQEAGLRIRKLQNDVSIAIAEGDCTAAELKKLQSEYDQILSDVGPNHKEVDVLKVEISKGISRDSSAERQLNLREHVAKRVSYYFYILAHSILYLMCMVGPILVAAVVFTSAYQEGLL